MGRFSWVLLLLCGSVGQAWGEARAPYHGTLAMGWFSAPFSLDPADAQGFAEVQAVRLIYDTPYRLDAEGKPIPSLVIGSKISNGGRRVLLRLRAGVKFHDGSEVTAADVASSLARARGRSAGWVLGPIKTARALGPDLLELTLTRRTPELGQILATTAASVSPSGRDAGLSPVGSGPFMVTRWSGPGSRSFVLEAFPQHFAGRPYLDRIEARAYDAPQAEGGDYETGAIGWSYRGATAFPGRRPKHATQSFQSSAIGTVFLGFGADHKWLRDPEVRRAIDLAIDRDAARAASASPGAAVAAEVVPPALGGAKSGLAPVRDLTGAQGLLAAASRRDPELASFMSQGGKLTILVDATRIEDYDVALKLLDMLQGAGLDGRVERTESQDFAARTASGRCSLYLGQSLPPLPDRAFAAAAALAAAGDGGRIRAGLMRAPLDVAALRDDLAQRVSLVPLFHRALQVHLLASLRGFLSDPLRGFALADLYLLPALPATRTPP